MQPFHYMHLHDLRHSAATILISSRRDRGISSGPSPRGKWHCWSTDLACAALLLRLENNLFRSLDHLESKLRRGERRGASFLLDRPGQSGDVEDPLSLLLPGNA